MMSGKPSLRFHLNPLGEQARHALRDDVNELSRQVDLDFGLQLVSFHAGWTSLHDDLLRRIVIKFGHK
jgi:hypothetical protein